MKKFKKLMIVGMVALAALIGFQSSSNALMLGFWDDFTYSFFTVADGSLSDFLPLDSGAILYSGVIGNWNFNVTTGRSSGSASMPQLNLTSINVTSTAKGGHLIFGVVDGGFTGTGPYSFEAGGTTNGIVSFSIFGSPSNAENFTGAIFGPPSTFAHLGPFSDPPTEFSGATSVGSYTAAGPGLFSLGIIADIWHDPAANRELTTSFSASLTAVPEPMSLILLGTGLIALATFRKKFRK